MNSNLRGTYRKMFLREEGFSMESPRSNQIYTDFGWSVMDNGTAVIPVVGTLGDWNPYSYITGMIEDALSMEKVDSIVLMINSPGGAVAGLFDTCRYIEKASKKKETESSEEVKQPKKEEPKLSTAVEYINRIDTLNKAIPNEEITNGLYQTCDLLKQIDLSNSEKKSEKLKKLYDYYLPILVNILEKYHQLDSSPIKGEELETCKTQLIKTILLINQALKTIYSSLHEEDYMNLNADITTLQSLLKKDGLVDNPFGGDDNE